MSSANNDFLNQLIVTFRLEADEHLQAMVNGLLTLETDSTPDEQRSIVETIFREAHSLKGAARAVDLGAQRRRSRRRRNARLGGGRCR